MPIYEFFCPDCNVIFSFLSRSVNTRKRPACPTCRRRRLRREVSRFALTGNTVEPGDDGELPFDESKMAGAVEALAHEAANVNEDDPRQAAGLMRKLSQMTGMEFGAGMEEAIGRMEAGEDPEQIEADMGDLLDSGEDPLVMPDKKAKGTARHRAAPTRDDTLYEM